ncbi:MAG: FadR/GntR family transcriptional regulator [Candidatus Alcyoniella australis]|nr:FadR/GntR family transcriptional regulator [Candidatus Alcyoniella australis]
MKAMLDPIKTDSLKDVFIARFEELILSGKLSIGQRLPSERELALQLGVSRPVVHEGLVDLEFKGLVSMKPRVGTVVNDYRRQGSLALLTSLVNYRRGLFEPRLLASMLQMRMLFEIETARLAAHCRSDAQLAELRDLLKREQSAERTDIAYITELDFELHHMVALASDNMIYPLVINSFKQVYTNLTGLFFSEPAVVEQVFAFHRELVEAIAAQDEQRAAQQMQRILEHGAEHLGSIILKQQG